MTDHRHTALVRAFDYPRRYVERRTAARDAACEAFAWALAVTALLSLGAAIAWGM